MSAQWYLARQGNRYGPYSWEQMVEFAAAGQVTPEDLVWSEGMSNWTRAVDIEGLCAPPAPSEQEAAPPPPPPPPPPPAPLAETVQPSQPSASSTGPSAGASGGEQIAGIIPAIRRKTGLFSSKTYSLVVTDRRILFAEITQQMATQAAKDAAEEAKAQGKGFFARAAQTALSGYRIYQKYWQMAPEAILAETPGNYAVELRDIVSVRVRAGMWDEVHDRQNQDEMHIKTHREKMKLTFVQGSARDAKKLLQGLLGTIVR
jgi:hypothetical protein